LAKYTSRSICYDSHSCSYYSYSYRLSEICSKCRHYIQPAPAAKKRSFLPLLLLLTELAYIATYLTSMGLNGWAFEDLKLNPMAGGSASTLTTLGAVDYDEIVYHHQWWRFLAAPFVCSGECFLLHQGQCCTGVGMSG